MAQSFPPALASGGLEEVSGRGEGAEEGLGRNAKWKGEERKGEME